MKFWLAWTIAADDSISYAGPWWFNAGDIETGELHGVAALEAPSQRAALDYFARGLHGFKLRGIETMPDDWIPFGKKFRHLPGQLWPLPIPRPSQETEPA